MFRTYQSSLHVSLHVCNVFCYHVMYASIMGIPSLDKDKYFLEEEKVTVCLRPLAFNTNSDTVTSHTPSVVGRDENSNHVEATVTLPFQPVNSCSVDEVVPAGDDINQLRRLRKRRAAAVALDFDGGKKSRDSESEYWI